MIAVVVGGQKLLKHGPRAQSAAQTIELAPPSSTTEPSFEISFDSQGLRSKVEIVKVDRETMGVMTEPSRPSGAIRVSS